MVCIQSTRLVSLVLADLIWIQYVNVTKMSESRALSDSSFFYNINHFAPGISATTRKDENNIVNHLNVFLAANSLFTPILHRGQNSVVHRIFNTD